MYLNGRTVREEGAMDVRLVSLLDREGSPEETPARLEVELDRRRSKFPIIVPPLVSHLLA